MSKTNPRLTDTMLRMLRHGYEERDDLFNYWDEAEARAALEADAPEVLDAYERMRLAERTFKAVLRGTHADDDESDQ